MAIKIRKVADEIMYANAEAIRLLRRDTVVVGTRFHSGVVQTKSGDLKAPVATSDTVLSANATNLATALTLVNEILAVLKRHAADSTHVHKAADATFVAALAAGVTATDLATANTLANAIKAAYGTHLSQAGVHYNNDATNTVAAADATDQASLETLLNELKGDVNAHVASAPAGFSLDLVAP